MTLCLAVQLVLKSVMLSGIACGDFPPLCSWMHVTHVKPAVCAICEEVHCVCGQHHMLRPCVAVSKLCGRKVASALTLKCAQAVTADISADIAHLTGQLYTDQCRRAWPPAAAAAAHTQSNVLECLCTFRILRMVDTCWLVSLHKSAGRLWRRATLQTLCARQGAVTHIVFYSAFAPSGRRCCTHAHRPSLMPLLILCSLYGGQLSAVNLFVCLQAGCGGGQRCRRCALDRALLHNHPSQFWPPAAAAARHAAEGAGQVRDVRCADGHRDGAGAASVLC